MNAKQVSARSGFTLIEMLMVILIISMLISLLLPAVNAARNRAREAAAKTDVEQLIMGMEQFKNLYGGYPPDRNWTDQEMTTALRRVFPRGRFTSQDVLLIKSMDQAEMLVFWLGGIFDGTKMTGFAADPLDPFRGPSAAVDPFARNKPESQRTAPLLSFDPTRLADMDGDGFPEYYPFQAKADQAPYVFFAARPNGSYLDASGSVPFYRHGMAGGVAVPYQRFGQPTTRFWAEERYQILCCGLDNDFGENTQLLDPANKQKFFPDGQGWGPGDADNIVSFATGRIGDSR